MSGQDHALEGADFKDKNPAPDGSLEVAVQPFGKGGVHPQTITLTNRIHTVRWICNGRLPLGARLQIHILGDLRGPFLDLVQSRFEAFGYGNRGPLETVGEYEYEARIVEKNGTSRLVGQGTLLNKATKAVNHPHAGGVDTQPEVPPIG